MHKRPPPFPPALALAALLYVALHLVGAHSFGTVGEVVASWSSPIHPAVTVDDQGTWADPGRTPNAAHRIGGSALALDAAQVRPLESLRIFGGAPDSSSGLRLPLAVNTYTGGLPDWPSSILFWLSRSTTAVNTLHALLGFGLLVLLWRLLGHHRARVGAGIAVLWLASDWNFVFYRKVLGGTELALLLASMLVIHGIWERRWGGGRNATLLLGLGIAIGLHAKITFGLILLAAAVATLLTRWDRGRMNPPLRSSRAAIGGALLIGALGLLPMLITWLHHGLALTDVPHLRSHDFLGLQWRRLFSGLTGLPTGAGPAREATSNLLWFLIQPLQFFKHACGAEPIPAVSLGRLFTLVLLVVGTFLAWRSRVQSASDALLRWLSIATPIAWLGLFFANRDIHHLAATTCWLAMWGGLAIDQVAGLIAPPRGGRRGLYALLLLVPWVLAGFVAIGSTDSILERCETPLIRDREQQQISTLLADHQVRSLSLISYDLYGVLEITNPDIAIHNAWGSMSQSSNRRQSFHRLIEQTEGQHLLLVRPNAPTIYDYHPSTMDLKGAENETGLLLKPIEILTDKRGSWARLFYVVNPTN